MIGSANAIVALSLIAASPQFATWETDYGKALQATRNNNRPLLVVLDSAAESKFRIEPVRLSNKLHLDDESAALLGSYELCHVDVTTAYGQRVAKAFNASEFPFTAIIDTRGRKIIYKKTGKLSESEWRTTLVTHKEGKVPSVLASDAVVRRYFDSTYCPSCQRR